MHGVFAPVLIAAERKYPAVTAGLFDRLADQVHVREDVVESGVGLKPDGPSCGVVGLAGGVFQNRILTEQAIANLTALGFEVYLPESLPAGDGGLSFGQLISVASSNLNMEIR